MPYQDIVLLSFIPQTAADECMMCLEMKRREILKLSAAVPATLPVIASAQQTKRTSAAKPKAEVWNPRAFDTHQNATVIVLTDLIIPATDTPGAKAANANRYIDLWLAEGPDAERVRFLSGLAWLDGYTVRNHGKTFVRCTRAEQTAILEALDAGKDPGIALGNQFFRMMKSMTSRVYYATEIGFKELNKGGRPPASVGCKHPGHA